MIMALQLYPDRTYDNVPAINIKHFTCVASCADERRARACGAAHLSSVCACVCKSAAYVCALCLLLGRWDARSFSAWIMSSRPDNEYFHERWSLDRTQM